MTNRLTHLIDIGDDYHGSSCVCKAVGCGWTFKSESRRERLKASYAHISEMIQNEEQ